MQIALPAALGLYLLSQGATFPGIMMLVMAGVAAFAFTLWCAPPSHLLAVDSAHGCPTTTPWWF